MRLRERTRRNRFRNTCVNTSGWCLFGTAMQRQNRHVSLETPCYLETAMDAPICIAAQRA